MFGVNMNGGAEDKTIDDLAIPGLIGQISWCLAQYSIEQEESNEGDQPFRPKWSAFRTLQNNLFCFLNPSSSSQAVAVSTLLINIFSRVFSDICTDTPWDKETLINSARQRTQANLLLLLDSIEKALKKNDKNTDKYLWEAFRTFENGYNQILILINEEDTKAINSMMDKPS